jgi:UDP-glucuronate 4-epimerase
MPKKRSINILITGCAGFIGFHLSKKILENKNYNVTGIDNINNYYDIKLKKDRLKILSSKKNFSFKKIDITNQKKINLSFKKNKYAVVINLAAQAGVLYSIKNPDTYLKNNIEGFFNILVASNKFNIGHLIFASTSSVYGLANSFPLKENDNTDKPLSFYAATKKCNEVMAHSFSNVYKLPCTGLRFFTVYGPMGRPDMSLFKFTKGIINKKHINLNNFGNHVRDFTYIDDIVNGIDKLINKPPKQNIPFEIFNIGSSKPKRLKFFLSEIENNLGIKAKIKYRDLQVGDIYKTHASVEKLKIKTGYQASTNIKVGIKRFIDWYKNYFLKK